MGRVPVSCHGSLGPDYGRLAIVCDGFACSASSGPCLTSIHPVRTFLALDLGGTNL